MAAVVEIIHAANFAAIKHKEQRRRDVEGTPYINHTIGVAHFLTQVATKISSEGLVNF